MRSKARDTDAAFGTSRVSPQRRKIVSAAATRRGAFTVEELAQTAGADNAHLGIATVYRAVAALEASGWLERVGERDGSALYARCRAGRHHHHHVVCESCGRVEATECPLIVTADSPVRGFRITRHDVTLYGLCPECWAAPTGQA